MLKKIYDTPNRFSFSDGGSCAINVTGFTPTTTNSESFNQFKLSKCSFLMRFTQTNLAISSSSSVFVRFAS